MTLPRLHIVFGSLTGLLLLALTATAQPLRPEVRLTRPAPGVHNALDGLRTGGDPRVAVLFSGHTADHVPGGKERVEAAVYHWELLLLGLHLPYRVLDDGDLSGGVPRETRVLILPDAEALSGKQKRKVRDFVRRGGGLLASGRTGLFDEHGRPAGDAFFADLFGAEPVDGLPPQAGLMLALAGGHPVTDGLPAGYALNLTTPEAHAAAPLTAARPVTATPLGRPQTYTGAEDAAFDGVTLLLGGTYGAGRFVWSRFLPQQVSRVPEQQVVYEGLVVNALAYAAQVPVVAVRAWPGGARSATAPVVLPAVGYDAAWYAQGHARFLDVLAAHDARGTVFLNAREAAPFPDLLGRLARAAEVALSGDTDALLVGQTADVQAGRLNTARAALERSAPGVRGLYPPGGLYDVATLEAAQTAGLAYALLPGTGRLAPGFLDWHERLDFRAPLPDTLAPSMPPPEQRTFVFPLATAGTDYAADFARIHAAGGLYVAPFYAENRVQAARDAGPLADLLERARTAGSWVASLGDIHDWWLRRARVRVALTGASDRAVSFEVVNDALDPLPGLSVDLRLPAPPERAVTAPEGATLTVASDGRTLTLVFPNLPPGTSRFTLSLR